MQRLFRGYRGRKRAAAAKRAVEDRENKAYFDYMATKIQKVWRGYSSRKNIQDFYKRKRYIQAVNEKSAKMMYELDQLEEYNQETLRREKERAMAAKFASLTSNMHHLISTKTQPGVFNAAGAQTTAFGIPIEEHIKSRFSTSHRDEVDRLQRSIRARYGSRGPSRGPSRQTNFYPFGSKSRRFKFSPAVSPLGPSPTHSENGEDEPFTFHSAPSPVQVRKRRLQDKAARMEAQSEFRAKHEADMMPPPETTAGGARGRW